MTTNQDVAEVLEAIALLMEVDDVEPFRVRAYRAAADEIRAWPEPVADMVAANRDLTELQGVGQAIAARVTGIVVAGREAALAELERATAPGILHLLRVPGLGPKRARVLRDELGVTSLEAAREACEQGRVRTLPGFGKKTEETLLRRVKRALGEE